ncbi:conserved exported protein of unknown function [Tenacibaculum sp. 190130A14a]|uniref:Uncharacterized protein n=1 Tax=Tenacibaculum polynesiense TaxID=3137857 RepID=A0ABP1EXL5_9FLAO
MEAQKKYTILLFSMLLSLCFNSYASKSDVYFVFYATINGKSGHAGIAVDNYKTVVKEYRNEKNELVRKYEKLKTGTLTYYDLWPEKDDFNAQNVDKDVKAKYFKLPKATWEERITVNSLITKGIPHEEHYPVDGLLKISSTSSSDEILKNYIEELIDENKAFNVRTFNCADFVELIIEKLCACEIYAEEAILFRKSTTPNKLYKAIEQLRNTSILKDGSKKAEGSFTLERLIKQ